MKLLVLGGTVYLGRHLVEAALAADHTVTLFNRGQHDPELFEGVEKLRGDRDGDLAALAGGQWDAVIDTCGYLPRIVEASAVCLADSVAHYTFISSCSVYAQPAAGRDESGAVGRLAEPTEEITGESYGPLKALCEQAVEANLPGRTLTVRPGLIVGPHDPSDRFTYWPARIDRGGRVLAPGTAEAPVQWIDVRDLAAWIIRMAAAQQTGCYNAISPAGTFSFGEMLATCEAVSGRGAELVWLDEAFLLAQGVAPFSELPMWLPVEDQDFWRFSAQRAIAAGLQFRALEQTVRDTLVWHTGRPAGEFFGAAMGAAREAELLGSYESRQS